MTEMKYALIIVILTGISVATMSFMAGIAFVKLIEG
jgi:hypothetical protein